MRKLIILILVILLAVFLFRNQDKEENLPETATRKVDEITTEAADTVVKKVRTPINKARGTKDLGGERTEAIDKAMQGQ